MSVFTDDEIIQRALAILAAKHQKGHSIENPADTRNYVQLLLAERKNEVFCVLFLDNKHRVLSFEEMFFGTIDGASVHPRVIVQRALELNAAAIILVHNHPSGVAEPSQADHNITGRIKDALALMEIRILDHIVVSAEGTVSFAERGML